MAILALRSLATLHPLPGDKFMAPNFGCLHIIQLFLARMKISFSWFILVSRHSVAGEERFWLIKCECGDRMKSAS